jgi:hypothetical protein
MYNETGGLVNTTIRRDKDSMINNIESCSLEEIQSQIAYLVQTPVAGIASLLQSGQCESPPVL